MAANERSAVMHPRGNSLLQSLILLLQSILPLVTGLAIGIMLVRMLATLPTKWGVFLVGAAAISSVLVLVGIFSKHLRGSMLFFAILGLPTFYSISFFFRENETVSVLANGFPISISEVFLAPLALAWLYRFYSDPQHPGVYFPRHWLAVLLLLLLINLVSALFVARIPFFSFSMLFLQVKVYLTMFFIANYLRDEHDFRLLGYAFAGVLILEGVVVVEQQLLGVVFTAENMGRVVGMKSKIEGGGGLLVRHAGTLSHPNDMAMYVNLCLPLVGFMLLMETKPIRRLYLVIAILFAMAALISSGSRGGWVGMGLGFATGLFFWLRKQGKNPLKGMAIMAGSLTVLFLVLMLGSQTFQSRVLKGDKEAAEVRIPLMEVAMEMISDKPVLGVGLNHYTREMVAYDRTNHFVATNFNQPVHNTFLMVGAETGLPAMLLLCILVFIIVKDAYYVAMHGRGIVSTVGFGMLCAMVSWFMHNQVNHSTIFGDSTLYVLLGALVAARNYVNHQGQFE